MLIPDRYVIFDLETTGFSPQYAEIIEIGAVRVANGIITERFQTYVKPLGRIPREITALTGISETQTAGAPNIEKAYYMFAEFIKDDVLIAISFPRYSTRIINAVEFAKNAGANIIALTDTEKSPIAAGADQLLLAQSDMVSFVDSLVAPLSILNAIIVAVAKKKQDEVTDRLRRLEEIWDEYDVYDKSKN